MLEYRCVSRIRDKGRTIVEDMRCMFGGSIALKELDLSSFNTSKVQNMLKISQN